MNPIFSSSDKDDHKPYMKDRCPACTRASLCGNRNVPYKEYEYDSAKYQTIKEIYICQSELRKSLPDLRKIKQMEFILGAYIYINGQIFKRVKLNDEKNSILGKSIRHIRLNVRVLIFFITQYSLMINRNHSSNP